MLDHKEMEAIAAGRKRTYGVLAQLYTAPPSGALMEMIREGGLLDGIGNSVFSAAANDLTAFFRDTVSAENQDNELVAEYTRLFVLPSGVVPHESIYLDEYKRLGGRVTVGVQQAYQDAGAQFTEACLELPDHIGVELEFMQFLCDIEEQFWKEPNWDGLQKSLDFQNGFLTEHLLRWHQPLCEKVLNETASDLYQALSRLTIEFLEAEREFVPELTNEIHAEWRETCVPES